MVRTSGRDSVVTGTDVEWRGSLCPMNSLKHTRPRDLTRDSQMLVVGGEGEVHGGGEACEADVRTSPQTAMRTSPQARTDGSACPCSRPGRLPCRVPAHCVTDSA